MQNFEQIRSHLASRHELRTNDPYLLSIELAVGDGRRQAVFLAEIEDDTGARFLRISTPVSPYRPRSGERCLRFNWEQRTGYLAIGDLAGVPHLQLCENRPYEGLDTGEIDRIIGEVGKLGDQLEDTLSDGGDSY